MNKILFFALFAMSILFSACNGNDPEVETGNASLVVKVVHVDGSVVNGANVALYGSQLDYQNETNMITSLLTDELGEAYFKDLDLKQYWFVATFNGYSNATSVSTTGRTLAKDERMEKTTQLRK